MIKFYFSFLFIVFSFCSVSQSLPYLNASTGNEGEFPVDKDTNIYMFHGSRLVKTDKNFNAIWTNTYSGITFSSVLLSKTGTLYFTSITGSFGRINANGSLGWVKATAINGVAAMTTAVSYTFIPQRLLLDRNNNLVVSGNSNSASGSMGFIIKTDTNGNAINFKAFGQGNPTYFDKFSIMTDSAGIYKFLGQGNTTGYSVNTALFRYNDVGGSMLLPSSVFSSSSYSGFGHKYIRSKFNNNYYIQSSTLASASYNMAGIAKVNMNGQVLWNKEFSKLGGTSYAFSLYLEEDAKGKLLYSIDNITGINTYTSALICLDSNGVTVANTPVKMIDNAGYLSSQVASKARVIYPDKYYFDVIGSYFSSYPLTVQKFDSLFLMPCSSITTLSVSVPANSPFPIGTIFTVPMTSWTVTSLSSVTSPTTFAVSNNLCTVLKTEEEKSNDNELQLYPNPSSDKLTIKTSDSSIYGIEVYDVNGKLVKGLKNVDQIDVSGMDQGIYFIRIKTDKGELSEKFIRE